MSDKRRLLNDLRVIDLRAELEKRNLDKSGVRGVLIQRLSKHIEEQGHDPTTFKFDLVISDSKTPSKKTRRSESTIEQEAEETPIMEDMIVQDDAGDDDETDPKETNKQNAEAMMEVDDNKNNTRKRENKDESEASEPKKACLDKEVKEDDHKTDNTDAEDSINLDLGEDELLNEETDSTTKPSKKDDAANEEADEPCDIDDAAGADGADDDAAAEDDAAPTDDQEANAEVPAISNDTDENEKDQKDEKDKEGENDKKDKKDESKEGGARNLWVSGLSGDTRAKDLKQLCSKHGKVIGAKVVTNARTPGSRCYGYVTMASSQDAENCIKNLHRTELHGRMISVEKAKSESESSSRRQPSRTDHHSTKDGKDENKDKEEGKEGAEKNGEGKPTESGAERARSTSRTREKSARSDKDRAKRSTRSRERRRSPPAPQRDVLSFNKIWKERDVARARERSRAAREEERRRRAAEEALRERERRQRQEKHRLALEREKLRTEREKIEREKNELLRLERERHRLEREKLELERMELKRAQIRLEEERRKRGYESSNYRKAASPQPEPAYERDVRHKRPPPPPISSSRAQFEAPPPPRFEMGSSYERSADKRDRGGGDRDYKRSEYPRHVSSSNMKYSSNGAADDARQPMPPGTRPKEPSRTYDSRDTRSYRPSPPSKPEPRSWNASSRYPDSSAPSKGSSSGTGGEAWSGGETRYAGYDTRYPPQYQPPPPGATYPDRYAQPTRDSYARKY